jgi:hypothetical protein
LENVLKKFWEFPVITGIFLGQIFYEKILKKISITISKKIPGKFYLAMHAAAVQDFLTKIFSTAFGCPRRGAVKES